MHGWIALDIVVLTFDSGVTASQEGTQRRICLPIIISTFDSMSAPKAFGFTLTTGPFQLEAVEDVCEFRQHHRFKVGMSIK
jgi:hypothetical protein